MKLNQPGLMLGMGCIINGINVLDHVKLMSKDVGKILRDQKVAEKFHKLGMIVSPNSVQEHGMFVKEQKDIWTGRVRAANIQPR